MSVELEPKNEDCPEVGLANGTWFELCRGPLKSILGEQVTNDPLQVDENKALMCAEAIRDWVPPEGWFLLEKEETGKAILKEFFEDCGGFTTR